MPSLPISVSFPQTTYDFVSSDGLVHTSVVAASITTPLVVPAAIRDGAAADGAAGQFLSAGAGGALLWADPAATSTLAQVLTAGNDADGQTIVNLASMALSADGGVGNCVLSAAPSSDLLNISTVADDTGSTYAFSGKYWPLVIDGTLYRVPLFV